MKNITVITVKFLVDNLDVPSVGKKITGASELMDLPLLSFKTQEATADEIKLAQMQGMID